MIYQIEPQDRRARQTINASDVTAALSFYAEIHPTVKCVHVWEGIRYLGAYQMK